MGGKPGGSAPLAADGVTDRVRLGVEINEVAASHIDGANAWTGGASIQTIEVDN